METKDKANSWKTCCHQLYFYHDLRYLASRLRYLVSQVPITAKMFSVKTIVQNVKLIELLGKDLAPLHFVISKSLLF